jgi:hypothetical protein
MLTKFSSQLAAKTGSNSLSSPPFAIRASDLDKNFALCFPVPLDGNNAPYMVVRVGNEGFKLAGNKVFDVCENGKPVKFSFFAERLVGVS